MSGKHVGIIILIGSILAAIVAGSIGGIVGQATGMYVFTQFLRGYDKTWRPPDWTRWFAYEMVLGSSIQGAFVGSVSGILFDFVLLIGKKIIKRRIRFTTVDIAFVALVAFTCAFALELESFRRTMVRLLNASGPMYSMVSGCPISAA